MGMVVSAVEVRTFDHAFDAFLQSYGRKYEKGSAEYTRRFAFFKQRMSKAQQHNANPNRLWTAGVGPLTDASPEEVASVKGWFGSASSTKGHGSPKHLRSGMFLNQEESLPQEWLNWTKLEAVQNPPDQGACGSCWAVATAAVLTAHAEIHSSRQRSFSKQELVDCVPNPRNCGGSGGCEGATVELAMAYTLSKGLGTEKDVPYTGKDEECKTDGSLLQLANVDGVDTSVGLHKDENSIAAKNFGMIGWERLPENKYKPLMRALVAHGPVGVSVSADSWDLYISGVFNSCSKDAIIDHAVTLVAYGKDASSGNKYWTIMNSWGKNWGEHGLIRLLRSEDEETKQCGTDDQPEVGTGCDGGPSAVKVCGMCGILYDNVVPHFRSHIGKP
eukprot:TRINITY_DN92496_c0_g1_i1.p1 TRINITY_DN92496_c0_g1~~TRINITY_DN92496_c0_g1_i1.p1  ORF type:complete len:422 (-),score=82.61 TRINITY_DN92496_c0_g1_i1:60-1223(-)